LRKGLQGGGKASVKSGGNIFAKFIEGAHVEAKGCIQADILMNSDVTAGESIVISGKKATIVGGITKAISGIDVTNAGNLAEVKTKLAVGVDEEFKERMNRIKTVFGLIDDMLKEIDTELAELEKKKNVENPQFAKEQVKERTMELLRKKIKCISDKAEFSKELEELEDKNIKSKGSCITVSKYTYPGVTIQANSASIIINQKLLAMQYRYEGGEVKMYDLFQGS